VDGDDVAAAATFEICEASRRYNVDVRGGETLLGYR
jgi:hypothetical protein